MNLDKPVVVQKFGGTSVKNPRRIKNVAEIIYSKVKKGYHVVAVVSAPGDTTDRLVDMANKITSCPTEREMDVLLSTGEMQGMAFVAMALNEIGCKAVSLTGSQVGILTSSAHSRARIKSIDAKKIYDSLARGEVAIVAGFQGVSEDDNITTLGRGGSDLSAVAIASVLKAKVCEIYTDVDGVYSSDPSVVKGAKKIDSITYDEMLELASAGANVMQSRSMEVAKKHKVKLHIKSSLKREEKGGTVVMEETEKTDEAKGLEDVFIRGVTLDEDQVRISIERVPDKPGVAAKIFGVLARDGINVDMIIQSSAYSSGVNDISFTIGHSRIDEARRILQEIKDEIGAKEIIIDEKVDKVSIVGIGMKSHAGVAARMFEVLSKKSINIEMISTSEIKISCVVSAKKGKEAVRELHNEFCE